MDFRNMSNPDQSYAMGTFQRMTAINALPQERLEFLQKVYSCFFLALLSGIAGVYSGLKGLFNVGSLYQGGYIIPFLLYIGLYFFLISVRKIPTVNMIGLLAFTFFSGLLTAPLIDFAVRETGNMNIVYNALSITCFLFGGLTMYVFMTRKDFSYLSGFLSMTIMGVLGFILAQWIFGFAVSAGFHFGFSIFMVALMSLFILYDTSMILKRFSTDEYILASIELYLDFVILFKHILMLLLSGSRRD